MRLLTSPPALPGKENAVSARGEHGTLLPFKAQGPNSDLSMAVSEHGH